MILNISTDPAQRLQIYLLCVVLFIGLFIYAFFWVKYKLKMPLLSVGVHQVMTLENPMYHKIKNMLNENKSKNA